MADLTAAELMLTEYAVIRGDQSLAEAIDLLVALQAEPMAAQALAVEAAAGKAGFDAEAHRRLVRTNWVRTVGWSLRSALVLGWVL